MFGYSKRLLINTQELANGFKTIFLKIYYKWCLDNILNYLLWEQEGFFSQI